jgi:hypothetical protein
MGEISGASREDSERINNGILHETDVALFTKVRMK